MAEIRTTTERDATRLRSLPVQAAPVARSRVGAARSSRDGIDPSWSFPKWVPDVVDWGLKQL